MKFIDVWAEGLFGSKLRELLADSGCSVRLRTRSEHVTFDRADSLVVVYELDARSDPEILFTALKRVPRPPCVLVGDVPEEHELRSALRTGFDQLHSPAVNPVDLVVQVELLASRGPLRSEVDSEERRPPIEAGAESPYWREPTVALQADGDTGFSAAPASSVSAASAPVSPQQEHPNLTPESSAPSTRRSLPASSVFSDYVNRLLVDAEARIYKDAGAVELDFVQVRSIETLVGDEILAAIGESGPKDADEVEGFTMIHQASAERHHAMALTAPGLVVEAPLGRGMASDADPLSADTRQPTEQRRTSRAVTEASAGVRVQDLAIGTVTADGRGRRGLVESEDLFRLLWEAGRLRMTCRLSVETRELGSIELAIRKGRVREFRGPVHQFAMRKILGWNQTTNTPQTERHAEASWSQFLSDHRLDRLQADRLLAEARAEIVYRLFNGVRGSYVIHPVEGSEVVSKQGFLLPLQLTELAFEALRRSVERPWLMEAMGSARLQLSSNFIEVLEDASIEPEVISLLDRNDGAALGGLLSRDLEQLGLAGVLYGLSLNGTLRLLADSDQETRSIDRVDVEAMVRAAFRLAQSGDYFQILGVTPTAHPRSLAKARAERVRALSILLLESGSVLERMRQEGIEAIEEAFEVLKNARLREAYADALLPSRVSSRSAVPPV
ncbi:MAG: hypothetical protein AAF355_13865 [Myxococcota bacterium]